jgi:hypothetical protein
MTEQPPADELVQKSIRAPKRLWEDVEAEAAALGGIDLVQFVRIALANEVRRQRLARVAEERAAYGRADTERPPPAATEPEEPRTALGGIRRPAR